MGLLSDIERLNQELDERSGDRLLRYMLADALEESAGTVDCGRCRDGQVYAMRTCPDGIRRNAWADCLDCSGTGRVSDGRRERAEGYRVLAQLGLYACRTEDGWARPGYANPDEYVSDGRDLDVFAGRAVHHCLLPAVWLMAVPDPYGMKPNWVVRDTRREIDDAVALAWDTLPDEVRARILKSGK